jgi:hypothetical protein
MRKTVTKWDVRDSSLFLFLLLQQGMSGMSDYDYEIYSRLNRVVTLAALAPTCSTFTLSREIPTYRRLFPYTVLSSFVFLAKSIMFSAK